MTGRSSTDASRRARGLVLVKVWLPAEVVAELDAIAQSEGVPRAEIIRRAIGVSPGGEP